MKPVLTRGHTTNFNAPDDWDAQNDGPCGVLSVRTEPYGRFKSYNSTWKPDAEELAQLMRGGVIELCCIGVQPPVAMSVVDPV